MENRVKNSALAALSRRLTLVGAALAALVCLLTGCAEERDAADVWPDGAWIVSRTDALARILSKLEEFDGSPLARTAAARRGTLPQCATVETIARADDFSSALNQLACAGESGPLARIREQLDTADILFSVPLGRDSGEALRGSGTVGPDGKMTFELTLPQNALAGRVSSLLIPGSTPPGPVQLNRVDELIHARIRPETALDIASLVAEGGQADRLFRLKSRLFAGTVLDGSWETVIYLPAPGRRMPHVALALGVSHIPPAVAAMEEFIGEMQRTWPVHRSPFNVHGAVGACLLDLNILPDFAPCYVATESALVAGWNPASLRHALAQSPAESASGASASDESASGESELVIELGRFSRADALLAAAARAQALEPFASTSADNAAKPLAPAASYPWHRVVAERIPAQDAVKIELTFEPGAGA